MSSNDRLPPDNTEPNSTSSSNESNVNNQSSNPILPSGSINMNNQPIINSPAPVPASALPASNGMTSHTVTYHLDPITNQLVRSENNDPNPAANSGISIQTITHVLGPEGDGQPGPHTLFNSIMNSIMASMGVAPPTPLAQAPGPSQTPVPPGPSQPTEPRDPIHVPPAHRPINPIDSGPSDTRIDESTMTDIGVNGDGDRAGVNDGRNTSTPISISLGNAPFSSSSTSMPPNAASSSTTNQHPSSSSPGRRTIGVEEVAEDEYGDMPGLMSPSESSAGGSPLLEQTAEEELEFGVGGASGGRSSADFTQQLFEATRRRIELRQERLRAAIEHARAHLGHAQAQAGTQPVPGADQVPDIGGIFQWRNEPTMGWNDGDLEFGDTNPWAAGLGLNQGNLPGGAQPTNGPVDPANAANPPNVTNPTNPPTANGNPIRITRLPPNEAGLRNLLSGILPPGMMMGTTGMGFGVPLNMLNMLNVERPPDTRRAKELLRGLNVVPHGLVRRLERVEALKERMGKEKKKGGEGEGKEGEGNSIGEGRLLCPVCYDPLLPELGKEPEEDEMDVDLDEEVEAPDSANMEQDPSADSQVTDSTSADAPVTNPPAEPSSSTTKPEKKKPKSIHPYQQPGALIALPCTHIFHAVSCLKPWFETGKTTCPTCRFDIDPRSETLDMGWLNRRRTSGAANPAGVNGNPAAVPGGNNPAAAAGDVPPSELPTPQPGIAAQLDARNTPPPLVEGVPALTPNTNPMMPSLPGMPPTNPNPNINGNAPPDFRAFMAVALRNAIAQAIATAATGNPAMPAPGNPPGTQQQPGAQILIGLHPPQDPQRSGASSPNASQAPPSPQALAFQRAFDAQQASSQPATSENQAQPSSSLPAPSATQAPAQAQAQALPPLSMFPPEILQRLRQMNPPTNATSNAPGNPPNATGNPFNTPGTPRNVLVRDIFVTEQGNGEMDVIMRDVIMAPEDVPGFNWSDVPGGPGPVAPPSGDGNGAARGGVPVHVHDFNGFPLPPGWPQPPAPPTEMEGVEGTTPLAPATGTGIRPSPSPRLSDAVFGMRNPVGGGLWLPQTPRQNGSSGLSHSSLPSHSHPSALLPFHSHPSFDLGFTVHVTVLLGPDSNDLDSRQAASSSSNAGGSAAQDGSNSAPFMFTPPIFGPPRPVPGPDQASSSRLAPGAPNPAFSRPMTPQTTRHHPYASPRSSLGSSSISTSGSQRGIGSDEPNANVNPAVPPTGDQGDNAPAAEQDGPNVSFSRHSITFSFSFGPDGFAHPPTATTNTMGPNSAAPGAGPGLGQMPFPGDGWMMGGDIMIGLGPPPPGATAFPRPPRSVRPKKKWAAPDGTSLRSVVEAKEREVGLRCDDVSCMWAPEDYDDFSTEVKVHEERVWLKKRGSDGLLEPSCAHRLHPECLLVAGRIADQHLDEEIAQDGDEGQLVEAACPFCRVRGALKREEWRAAVEKMESM